MGFCAFNVNRSLELKVCSNPGSCSMIKTQIFHLLSLISWCLVHSLSFFFFFFFKFSGFVFLIWGCVLCCFWVCAGFILIFWGCVLCLFSRLILCSGLIWSSYLLGLWFLDFNFVFLDLSLCSCCSCSRHTSISINVIFYFYFCFLFFYLIKINKLFFKI